MSDKKKRELIANAGVVREMAIAAAKSQTLPFASLALDSLIAIGFSPLEPLFWAHYGSNRTPHLNYLQWLSTEGAGNAGSPMLMALLKSGISPDSVGEPAGQTALWIAAYQGDVSSIAALIEAGASWSARSPNQNDADAKVESMTATEALMLRGPRENSDYGGKKAKLTDQAKKWGELLAQGIEEVKADRGSLRSIIEKLAASTASEEALAPVGRALFLAGADPLKKTRQVEDSELAPGRVSPMALSACFAARDQTSAFFVIKDAFADRAKQSSSDTLAAFSAGMTLRVDDFCAESDQYALPKKSRKAWLSPEKKESLIEAFASADPCQLAPMGKGALRINFAYALGLLCQPGRVGASEFDEGVELLSGWIKKSRELGGDWSAGLFVQSFAKGASDTGALSQEQDDRLRTDILPRSKEFDAVWDRAKKMLSSDAELAAAVPKAKALIAAGWAQEAGLSAKEADRGDEMAKKWADFAEAVRSRLESNDIRSNLSQEELDKALELLSAGAARAARKHKFDDEDDEGCEPIGRRLERFSLSVATSLGSGAPSPSKPVPRL